MKKTENGCLMSDEIQHFLNPSAWDVIADEWTDIWKIPLHFKCPPLKALTSACLSSAQLLVFNEMWTCHFLPRRFYIETISLLKEHTTVELFFLNAKTAIYNVRSSHLVSFSQHRLHVLSRPKHLQSINNSKTKRLAGMASVKTILY